MKPGNISDNLELEIADNEEVDDEKVAVDEVKDPCTAAAQVITAREVFPQCTMFQEGDVLKSDTLMVQI